MYAKTQNNLVFFKSKLQNTDKVIYGNLSESNRVNGEYEYTNWTARFVGNAYELARKLVDKDRITVLQWSITKYYDKAKDKEYVTLNVYDFEFKNSGE